jgi:hypothetical protein
METYAAVRAHGVKSRLLSRQDYEALIAGSKRIWDFPDYAHLSERDSLEKKLEKIYKVYINRMSLLAKIPEVSDFVFALLDRLEVENIKFHLRYLAGYQRPVLYYPYSRLLGAEKLMSLRTESAIWEALSNTLLRAPASPSFKTRLIAEREVLLGILYYNYLLNTINNLKIGKDVINSLTELVTNDFTASYATWKDLLPDEVLSSLFRTYAPRLRVNLKLLENLKGTTTEIIQEGIRMLTARARAEALNHPLDLVYIYALNHLLLAEAQNLERILVGKELGIAEEVIIKNLILL